MVHDKLQSRYKKTHTFEFRSAEAKKVLLRHPDRLLVVCEKVEGSNVVQFAKDKFLVAPEMTVGQFLAVLRNRVKLEPQSALFVFVNGIVPQNATPMVDLFTKYKDDDGFLYMKYAPENVFGGAATAMADRR